MPYAAPLQMYWMFFDNSGTLNESSSALNENFSLSGVVNGLPTVNDEPADNKIALFLVQIECW